MLGRFKRKKGITSVKGEKVWVAKLRDLISTPELWEVTEDGHLQCKKLGLRFYKHRDGGDYYWVDVNDALPESNMNLFEVDLNDLRSNLIGARYSDKEDIFAERIDRLLITHHRLQEVL